MNCTKPNCECRKKAKWQINSPEYENCFWQYLHANPRPHTLQEVSNLLNIAISVATTLEKKAIAKLKRKLTRNSVGKTDML